MYTVQIEHHVAFGSIGKNFICEENRNGHLELVARTELGILDTIVVFDNPAAAIELARKIENKLRTSEPANGFISPFSFEKPLYPELDYVKSDLKEIMNSRLRAINSMFDRINQGIANSVDMIEYRHHMTKAEQKRFRESGPRPPGGVDMFSEPNDIITTIDVVPYVKPVMPRIVF